MSDTPDRVTKIFGLAAAALLGACASPQLACPSYSGGAPLWRADVIDGPPAEMAILKPDTSTGTMESGLTASWDVSYIHATGRKLFISCYYAGVSPSITLSTSAPIQSCAFQTRPPQPARLMCQ